MAGKCPNCKKEIDHLQDTVSGRYSEDRSINASGDYDFGDDDRDSDDYSPWSCPECNHEFTFDDKEAVEFLNKVKPRTREQIIKDVKKRGFMEDKEANILNKKRLSA
jgi:hypothetical protein